MSHVTAMDDAQTLQNINFHSAAATKKAGMSGRVSVSLMANVFYEESHKTI